MTFFWLEARLDYKLHFLHQKFFRKEESICINFFSYFNNEVGKFSDQVDSANVGYMYDSILIYPFFSFFWEIRKWSFIFSPFLGNMNFSCYFIMQNKSNKKSSYFQKMWNDNRATSRFEAHLVFKHPQKPDFLISNAR